MDCGPWRLSRSVSSVGINANHCEFATLRTTIIALSRRTGRRTRKRKHPHCLIIIDYSLHLKDYLLFDTHIGHWYIRNCRKCSNACARLRIARRLSDGARMSCLEAALYFIFHLPLDLPSSIIMFSSRDLPWSLLSPDKNGRRRRVPKFDGSSDHETAQTIIITREMHRVLLMILIVFTAQQHTTRNNNNNNIINCYRKGFTNLTRSP